MKCSIQGLNKQISHTDLVFFGDNDDAADLIHFQTSDFFPSISCNSDCICGSFLLISFLTRSQIFFNRCL